MGAYTDALPGRMRAGQSAARGEDDTDKPEDRSKPSLLDEAGQFLTLKSWWEDDSNFSRDWRSQASSDFDFVAGDQWSPEDETALKDQKRVPVVFNRTITMLRAVAGMEINGRHEISFLPRNTENAKVNEVLTGASKWMADNCDGEDEESEAFQHALICGMGWNEHRLDFEEEPDGKYIEQAINPLEMYWDKTARKKNLADARRLHRVKRMPASDAMALFPGFTIDDLDAKWAEGHEPGKATQSVEERRKKQSEAGAYPDRCEVTIVQVQWWERATYWLVADPATNTKAELSDADYQKLTERGKRLGLSFPAAKMVRRVYKQAFLGSKVLECGDGPIPDRFTFTCVTGEIHHNKGTWFGLIRVMRDPAMWANKWLVQTLHIMNANAKGGILAETDAFEDQRQAEATYARPEAITWMKKGALSGANGAKFQKKPTAEFPAGYFNLLEFAISSLRDVTGINLELLGLKDVNQPGILEAQRKQAGMTVLATMFDALRRARKQTGRIRLYYIQNFLSDGRLIRITGPEGAQVIPLIRDKTLGIYDVVVDDTPSAPNQKQANWLIIQPMLVAFRDQLMARPDIFAMLLDYSPLPSRVVEAVKAAILKSSPQQEEQAALGKAAAVAKIKKDEGQAQLFTTQARTQEATAYYDIAMAQNLMAKNNGEVDSVREGLDAAHKAAQIGTEHAKTAKIHAETAKTEAEIPNTHADTAAKHVSRMIDMLTPIPQPAMAQ
jgi:hypothetical protein